MSKKMNLFEQLVACGADPAIARGKIVSGEIPAGKRLVSALDVDKAIGKAIEHGNKAIETLAVSAAFDARSAFLATEIRRAIEAARNIEATIEAAHSEAIEENKAREAARKVA